MHVTTTTTAVLGAASATAPPLASITAAANCVGACARRRGPPAKRGHSWAGSPVGGREIDHSPKVAEATAAHTHNTPTINMASQYEAPNRGPCPHQRGLLRRDGRSRRRHRIRLR